MEAPEPKKEQPYCTYCGSTDVSNEAICTWDFEKQEWVSHDTYDKAGHCNSCGTSNQQLGWK